MDRQFSIEELATAVNAWCDEHAIAPASGQAGERVTERNIRYYRTAGLLDAPESGGGAGFGEKHFLQLAAIRILQSQGVPLSRIRELLFGRSIRELRTIQSRGAAEAGARPQIGMNAGTDELWRVIALDADFMLVSRRASPVSAGKRARILSILKDKEHGREASRAKLQRKEIER